MVPPPLLEGGEGAGGAPWEEVGGHLVPGITTTGNYGQGGTQGYGTMTTLMPYLKLPRLSLPCGGNHLSGLSASTSQQHDTISDHHAAVVLPILYSVH